ncbi:MAG: 4a-hydroxytetrahydrobiopterin dehydratase [Candidatus Nanopelagicales bacterium]
MRPQLLTESEVNEHLKRIQGWSSDGRQISRSFEGTSFPAVIAWVTAIADAAEILDHHPDLDIRWTTLRIAITTHDRGGLTELDFRLAQQIDEICQ